MLFRWRIKWRSGDWWWWKQKQENSCSEETRNCTANKTLILQWKWPTLQNSTDATMGKRIILGSGKQKLKTFGRSLGITWGQMKRRQLKVEKKYVKVHRWQNHINPKVKNTANTHKAQITMRYFVWSSIGNLGRVFSSRTNLIPSQVIMASASFRK